MSFETILYTTDGPIATITLNRPEQLNTIVPPMPDEVEDAVTLATRDDRRQGDRPAWRRPCVLRRLRLRRRLQALGRRDADRRQVGPGKDFAMATAPQLAPTQKFLSIWRCPSPSSRRSTAGASAAAATSRSAPTS
jgi:enoyl-CoA hydratase